MLEEIVTIITILGLTMLKFIAGPTLGYAAGFSLFGTISVTVAGTMLSVLLFTFLGTLMRERVFKRFFRKKRVFTPRNRRFVRIWKTYGLPGVAFLTPLILTPTGGTILLTTFGSAKGKILVSMFLSAAFWATFFSVIIYKFGSSILPFSTS